MATVRGISETSIVFDGNNGHSHDGTAENGSLIDVTKYSIYDFSPTKINTADNQRSIRQDNNINAFNNKVAEIVNTLVLRPAGIILQEETLNGNYIIANTVTSSQIAANTITASEIAANTITTNELTSDVLKSSNYSYTSGNFSNAGTFFDLSDGSIISKNFAIDSSGNAYFTGAVNATSGTFSGSISSTATISGGTLSGATITGSTLSAGDPTGDGVTINGTRVLINTTGGSGSGAARLKFNTNASSGDNFIESDKRLVLTAGGSGYTKILVGSQTGSAQDVVNVEATDLQLNGTSVLTSGSLPSGTIWTSNNDGAGSGLNADLLDGNHASAFADVSHGHSGYSPTSHNHNGTYLPISGGTLTGNLTVTNITVPAGYGLYSDGWIFANGNRIVWPGSGYGRLAGSTEVDGNFRTVGGGSVTSAGNVSASNGVLGGYLSATGAIYGGSLSISGTKNFAINHPLDESKILLHCAVETPAPDVFYRGKGSFANGRAIINLPNYFESLVKQEDRAVIITPKVDSSGEFCLAAASEIVDSQFTVVSHDCADCTHEFYWIAFGVRKDTSFEAEPLKKDMPELTASISGQLNTLS